MRVASATRARLERRHMTARAVTDLPEPLSPTSATVWPLRTWNETSRTASITPPSTLKVTPTRWASITTSPKDLVATFIGASSIRVDRVAQAVAERVEREYGDQHEADRR